MERYILPKPQYKRETGGSFCFQNPEMDFAGCDARVQRAARELYDSGGEGGGKLSIEHGDGEDEGYWLRVTGDGVSICASSAAGAFYGLQTLRQLLQQGKRIPCMEVWDRPDFPYRGFYHDVSRGRIPSLETLKRLADRAASYKMNVLQIYVEHTFAFREYEGISDWQELLGPEDIREMDAYCRERFIDFQPSLSCFGHLYELLQSERYRHLCEMEDYQPKAHPWIERSFHHTIDPSQEESLEVICSMIDQYLPLFRSRYFNICCDETFDLGNGRSRGKDPGRLYVDFVKKLIGYLEDRGKTVMLWGDILLNHSELMQEISEKAIVLNWDYGVSPAISKIRTVQMSGRKQILCPGVQGWKRMVENVQSASSNIRTMALYARVSGALGILNTNWGDHGHLCDPENVAYGMILGASEAWNPGAAESGWFDRAVGTLHYRSADGSAVYALKLLGEADDILICRQALMLYSRERYPLAPCGRGGFDCSRYGWEELETRLGKCRQAVGIIEETLADGRMSANAAGPMLLAAQGYALLLRGLIAACGGRNDLDREEAEAWIDRFGENWKRQNRRDEWPVAREFLQGFFDIVQKKE